MHGKQQFRNLFSPTTSYLAVITLSFAMVFVLATVANPVAQAQTLTVLHTFNGADGAFPQAGLTMDRAGNLYGTTAIGGYSGSPCGLGGCGTVFKLSNRKSGWLLAPLYNFHGSDGWEANSRATLAQDGTLYGVTYLGGPGDCQGGCGTVYHLTPAPTPSTTALAPWNETAIHYFTIDDGAYPRGDTTFDQAGNIYVTAGGGGPSSCGVDYQLTPSGDGWVGTDVYSFQCYSDGANPTGGVVFDRSGNIYGVAEFGGSTGGTIYQLTPSGSTWIEQTLYEFSDGSGIVPVGGLIIDTSGNLYGTTTAGGTNGAGTVFEFTPGGAMKVLYNFPSLPSGCNYGYLCGSLGKLVMDAAGNLYGATAGDGAYGYGNVFKLTRSNGGWTYTSLHDFTGQGGSDGAFPQGGLVLGANGSIYGTASQGGINNNGTVFEITP